MKQNQLFDYDPIDFTNKSIWMNSLEKHGNIDKSFPVAIITLVIIAIICLITKIL